MLSPYKTGLQETLQTGFFWGPTRNTRVSNALCFEESLALSLGNRLGFRPGYHLEFCLGFRPGNTHELDFLIGIGSGARSAKWGMERLQKNKNGSRTRRKPF